MHISPAAIENNKLSAENIRTLIVSMQSIECFYCNRKSATITCNEEKCTRSFHLKCGYEYYCVSEFEGDYNSYCRDHCPVKDDKTYNDPRQCYMCYDYLPTYHPLEVVPTCCKEMWNHIECVKKWALSAGQFFNCILCTGKTDEYKSLVRKRGVFLPDRRATWDFDIDKKKISSCGQFKNGPQK